MYSLFSRFHDLGVKSACDEPLLIHSCLVILGCNPPFLFLLIFFPPNPDVSFTLPVTGLAATPGAGRFRPSGYLPNSGVLILWCYDFSYIIRPFTFRSLSVFFLLLLYIETDAGDLKMHVGLQIPFMLQDGLSV